MNAIFNSLLSLINVFHIERLNRWYWNLRAGDIDKKWGNNKTDYEVLTKVIKTTGAQKVLDIGCGSGRLFPLYDQLAIREVTAQDISVDAIKHAKEKSKPLRKTKINFTDKQIRNLDFPNGYFDLVISNRTLSAVFPGNIEETMKTLSRITKHIYLNEMSDSDYVPSSYWFKHEYHTLLNKNGFEIKMSDQFTGLNQYWHLFSRKNSNAG